MNGRYEDALACYAHAVGKAPGLAPAWCNQGVALHELGRYPEALLSLREALSIKPDDATAWMNCGNTLRALGKPHEAVKSFDQALYLCPADPHVLYARGNTWMDLANYSAAHQDLRAAVDFLPDWPDAHLSLGSALMELNRHHEALAAFVTAQQLAPQTPLTYFNCGCALNALNRPREALACFEVAAALGDQRVELYVNQGYALTELDRWEEAAASFAQAVKTQPESAPAWSNLGLALDRTKRFDDAGRAHERALEIQPHYGSGRYNHAFLQLRMGDYVSGFESYESRWTTADFVHRNRHQDLPLWDGQALPTGSRLLVFAEQGFGDTIQFSRYVGQCVQQGIDVTFQVPNRLVRLFRNQWPGVQIVADGESLPTGIAARIPLMSLPRIFRTTLNDIPYAMGFLRAESELVARWSALIKQEGPNRQRTTIGLMWQGGTATRYRNRSVQWETMSSILRSDSNFFSLQKDLAREEMQALLRHTEVQHFGDQQSCFADTAAMISLCNLVITVDTSVAHLSGAMGHPTWILLPYDADWRWLEDRIDCPWYENVTLYRQSADRRWEPVLERISADLEKLAVK